MTEEELQQRRLVWVALSDLFLDTELNAGDLERIAGVLRASGFGAGELEAILFDEVYPVCIPNMYSVAGEWAGFDPQWLERRILEEGPRRRWRWLQLGRRLIAGDWERVKELVARAADGKSG